VILSVRGTTAYMRCWRHFGHVIDTRALNGNSALSGTLNGQNSPLFFWRFCPLGETTRSKNNRVKKLLQTRAQLKY